MHVLTNDLEKLALPPECADRESIVTVGAFDGIHAGHQYLIEQLVAQAREQGRLAGLVTFYPHPGSVLHPQGTTRYLTTPGEKTALLEPLNLDWMAILPFSPELAATSPRAFVRHLYERTHMRSLWVGTGFALGRGRAGDIAVLRRLGEEMGFHVHEIAPISLNGSRVSSTQIRNLIQHGHVEDAAQLLRRPYTVFGEVVQGAQRGRCIGFPTANVDVRPDRVVPADGIYAGYARLGAERHPAVVYIGGRPTFDQGQRSVEAHLLDYEGDLYGCDLVIEFVSRLRGDRRFADIQELIAQIGRDVEQARQILAAREVGPPSQG